MDKIPVDHLAELVKNAMSLAIDMVSKINDYPCQDQYCYLFSDITASYILAFSYLATHLQTKNIKDKTRWIEIKQAAHESLDIAFRSVEKNMPLYEEKLNNHVNH